MQLINIKESKSSNIKHSIKSIENSFKRYWYNFINCNLLNTKASINYVLFHIVEIVSRETCYLIYDANSPHKWKNSFDKVCRLMVCFFNIL